MHRVFSSAIYLLALLATTSAADRNISITVQAGDFARRQSVVTFALPEGMKTGHALRRGGKLAPLQVGRDGRAAFIVEQLERGAEATYEVVTVPAQLPIQNGGVVSRREKSKVTFSLAAAGKAPGSPDRLLLEYQAEPGALPRDDIKAVFQRGAYLHPVRTPSGKIVTDDYPPNHIHHHGIWWSWTKTEFAGREPDFWNMGEAKGRVEFVSLDETWSGPVHGGFQSQHRFVDLTAPKPETALTETWVVTVYAAPSPSGSSWLFDLVSEQQCATARELKLPTYRYGGLGVRGNRAWNGKDKAFFLTSEGETDRDKGNTSRGRWCDLGGDLDGGRVGIAILCHPSNFRAPQPMRLHPDEPFFNFAPQQAGDMEIRPGQKYISRYRFVVHDGPPERAELDRLWNDYAHPPVVRVEEK